MWLRRMLVILPVSAALPAACAPDGDATADAPAAATAEQAAPEGGAWGAELARIRAAADSADAILHPLPLLRPAQEAEMRRFLNPAQLAEARRRGIDPTASADALVALERDGRLVRLPDSTDLWIVRRLDYSEPLLTPRARDLLDDLARRFQQRLADMGLPPYRLEVTSVLRTGAQQAALRRTNPNAAGETTHSYATTFDIAYSAFAPPARPIVEPSAALSGEERAVAAHLAATHAELVAARRSRELMAVLGEVLIAMQGEGRVMVTLERLQPVYHLTAR
jgi:hypothetical protein